MQNIYTRLIPGLILSLLISLVSLQAQPKSGDAVLQINPGSHLSQVSESVFTTDGRYIISVSTDKTICIWDVASRKLLEQIRPAKAAFNQGKMFAVAISPDNKWLAVGGFLAIGTETDGAAAGQIRIYDLAARKQVLRFPAHQNVVTALRFSADGKYLLSGGIDSSLNCWKSEVKAGKPLFTRIKKLIKNDWFQEDIQVAGQSAYVTEGKRVVKYSLPGFIRQAESPAYTGSILCMAVNKTANIVAAVSNYEELIILDTLLQQKQKVNLEVISSTVSISPDGGSLVIEGAHNKLLLFKKEKDKFVQHSSTRFEGGNLILGTGFLPDQRLFAAGGYGNLLQFYTLKERNGKTEMQSDTVLGQTGQIFNQIAVTDKKIALHDINDSSTQFTHIFYPEAGKLIRFNPTDASNFPLNVTERNAISVKIDKTGTELGIWSGNKKTGTVIRDGGSGYIHNCVTITRQSLIVSGANAGFLDIYDTLGNIRASLIGHEGNISGISESADGHFLYSTGVDQTTRVWDLREINEKRVFKTLSEMDKVWADFFKSDYPGIDAGKPGGMEKIHQAMIANGDYGNAAYLIKPQMLEPRLNMFIARNNEWVIWNNKGYFKASPGGAAFIGWYIYKGEDNNAEFYTADKLYDTYYRPDIVNELIQSTETTAAILQKFKQPETDLAVSKQVSNMPVLRLRSPVLPATVTQKNLRLSFDTEHPEFISEFLLFHNGKRVPVNTEALRGGITGDRSIGVELVAGDNIFTASLLNKNKVETTPIQFRISYTGVQATSSLYILAVGIDKYRNSRYNLNYARADARGISNLLLQSAGRIFKSVTIDTLFDELATIANIKERINTFKTKIRPEDVFLFYYAGHGIMNEPAEGTKPDFYLVLHPVVQMVGNEEMLRNNGLPAKGLRELLVEIPAQKQLVIFDACNSGGAMNVFTRGAGEEAAISQLARSTGFTVLASTNQEQFASELNELKHGIFTYALLKGLEGDADLMKDGKITVKEIELYLNEIIPVLSEKYKGVQQFPQSFSRGMDFPIILKPGN